MTELSRLSQAAVRLRDVYGLPELLESSNRWQTFLRVLLVGPSSESATVALDEALRTSLLVTPSATAQATTGQLIEQLTKIPRGPQKASLLRAVAEWWLSNFGDDCSPEWSKGVETYRESLRRIRGLGPATVDEILLFVGQSAVFPLDRGTLRVAIRHGWLDLPLEDEEAQNFFVSGLQQGNIEPRAFSLLISRVAQAHCGREPNCEDCPLQRLLPANGPLNPDSC